MRFLVDAQLPPALARWLAGEGHEAEHVADRQMAAASDAAIWQFAMQTSAVIITKDEDFAQRKALSDVGPAVIWIRLPNTRRQALLAWFETVAPDILAALERGETLVEVVGTVVP
jgi:predicted nuclease of predicted toxin-antitoxin system